MEKLTILMSSLKTLKTQRFPERSSNSSSSNEMSLVCVLSKMLCFPLEHIFLFYLCCVLSHQRVYETMNFVIVV